MAASEITAVKAVNKVEVNGETVIDLTQDTVTPGTLKQGVTAHSASGQQIVGTLSVAVEVPEKDINFYDYDATRLYSWTLEELASKTALPDLPSHSGLICQGWNWTLEQLKAEEGPMDVGAMYITDDGKTRYYITVTEDELSLSLGVNLNGSATVDWGDGTPTETLTSTAGGVDTRTQDHTYQSPGNYIVTLAIDSGNATLWRKDLVRVSDMFMGAGDKATFSYNHIIRGVQIGAGIRWGQYEFMGSTNMQWITTPISFDTFNGAWGFRYTGVKALFSVSEKASFNAAAACPNLRVLSLGPECSSLYAVFTSSFVDVKIPKSVSSFTGQTCRATGIKQLTVSQPIDVFSNYCMYDCSQLRKVTFREDVATIGQYSFTNCFSLQSVVFEKNVGTLGQTAFDECRMVQMYDFSHCTSVPVMQNSNVFGGTNINANCRIRVPAALVDEWKAATNWSTYADHIVGVGISKVDHISMIAGPVPMPVYVSLLNLPSEPTDFSVNVSPEGLTISDLVCMQTQLSFAICATDSTDGTFTVTMTVSGDEYSYTGLFDVTVELDGEIVE